MISKMNAVLFQSAVLAVLCATSTAVDSVTFRVALSLQYSATVIDKPREAQSLIECARICSYDYSACFSLTYNEQSRQCTSRSLISYSVVNDQRPPEDVLFFRDSCNKTLGFELFVYNSVIQCLYISTQKANFTNAREVCKRKGGGLYLAKSVDKLEVLRSIVRGITRDRTWIGLTDIQKEGVFVWEDKEEAVNLPWRAGNPDNDLSKENCGEMGSFLDFTFINDFDCITESQFICEKDNVI